jgi:hypothetical protein
LFSRRLESSTLSPWFYWQLLTVLLVAVERKKQRWCLGGEELFFFFSVQRPLVYVLLFLTSIFAFSPLSLKQIFLFFLPFPSVSVSLFSKKNPLLYGYSPVFIRGRGEGHLTLVME